VHTGGLTLVDFERNTILNALDRNGWRRMATARELGIDKNTLRRKIKRLNIVREESA
jgi:transcriptional regulator of acetoin/glycerol metabolism